MKSFKVCLAVTALVVLLFSALSWAGQAKTSGDPVIQPVQGVAPSQAAAQLVPNKSEVVTKPSAPHPVPIPLTPVPAVPRTMTYQGKLTNTSGQPVPDGNYQLILRLYTVPSGGSAIWTETDTGATKSGLFNVQMGAKVPLNLDFRSDYYLGVAAAGDPEMSPRTKLTSSGYAFRADSSAFSDTSTASARVGGHAAASSGLGIVPFTDGTTGLLNPAVIPAGGTPGPHGSTHAPGGSDPIPGYVKVSGDSMTGTLKIGALGTTSVTNYGVKGYSANTSAYTDYGGFFTADSFGTGIHYGVRGEAYGNTTSPDIGVNAYGLNSSSGEAYGVLGSGTNLSSGTVFGGYFSTASSGTGYHYGVCGEGYGGASSGPVYGVVGSALCSSTSQAYGSYGSALNSSSGSVYGGCFYASSGGTGAHYGVRGEANGGATSGLVFGTYGSAWDSSTSPAYGSYGNAINSSSGLAYGGYFQASSSGTGTHYGVYGIEAVGGTGAAVYAAGDFAASGLKNAVVRTSQGERLLACMESPEVWFEDVGEGKLANGRVHIELDPLYLQTVTIDAKHPMRVFVQLNDENCKGVAVKKGITGFDVVELLNGASNAAFDYRVLAKRKHYEDERLRATDVGQDDPNLYPERRAEIEAKMAKEREAARPKGVK